MMRKFIVGQWHFALVISTCAIMALVVRWSSPAIMKEPLPVPVDRFITGRRDELTLRHEPGNNRIDYGSVDPHDPKFYNIITEEEALSFEPCRDIRKAASVENSKFILTGGLNKTYSIGDTVHASVIIFDGYGHRKHAGGDQLRATIESNTLNASAPCVVTDIGDGTHAVRCEAMWSGTLTLGINLAYTREAVSSIYLIRTKILATRYIIAKFKRSTFSEESICHPNQTHLLQLTNYTQLCNMTDLNSGMPFYCGKPRDIHLLCQDWILSRTTYPELPVIECEKILLEKGQQTLKQTLGITVVTSHSDGKNISLIGLPSTPCSQYNISRLWNTREPTGFFYKGDWKLRHCLGLEDSVYMQCLKNRRLYLIGDSTMRQWYSQIISRFQCQPITEKWTKEKWHKASECVNKQSNIRVGWYQHSQPLYTGTGWNDVQYTLYSTARRIDNIPSSERAVIVIHVYMHSIAFHHSVFKERMEIIRRSVEQFLKRNIKSVVMIKAPHTYEETPAGGVRLSDYFGNVYSSILYKVFEGLHDKVVLLNNRDSTTALHVKPNHPPENVVRFMIDQMLNYVCH